MKPVGQILQKKTIERTALRKMQLKNLKFIALPFASVKHRLWFGVVGPETLVFGFLGPCFPTFVNKLLI